jgi:hypothetical protein
MSIATEAPTIPDDRAGASDQARRRDDFAAEADLLFEEAKRREHRRRLSWFGACLLAATAAVCGYLAASSVATSSSSPPSRGRSLPYPTVSRNGSCQASPGRSISNSFFGGVAFGNGPVRVLVANAGDLRRGHVRLGTTEKPGWFALETLWFAMPSYNGSFIVDAKRIGATGAIEVQPGPTGMEPGSGPLAVAAGPTANTEDGYRTVPGSTWVTSAGCYAWRVEGPHFSETIVVDALAH